MRVHPAEAYSEDFAGCIYTASGVENDILLAGEQSLRRPSVAGKILGQKTGQRYASPQVDDYFPHSLSTNRREAGSLRRVSEVYAGSNETHSAGLETPPFQADLFDPLEESQSLDPPNMKPLALTREQVDPWLSDVPFHYHNIPQPFCAVIFGLGSDRGERVGVDRTLLDGAPPDCALKVDDLESQFVVKDAWLPREELAGRESEAGCFARTGERNPTLRRPKQQSDRPTNSGGFEIGACPHSDCPEMFGDHRSQSRWHFMIPFLEFYTSINILINRGGAEANRGMLIDLYHAIRVGDTSPYSTKIRSILCVLCPATCLRVRNLTRTLMVSRHSTSFYVGFLWSTQGRIGSKLHPLTLVSHIMNGHSPPRLFDFFRVARLCNGGLIPLTDPQKHYDHHLGHTQQCTVDLEAEDLAAETQLSALP
ncbi:hypothetical protein JB92DRAFT_2827954 [Gautieria morchelliformis]|nr:hypothetical protein JB92DRAFT_2827954 [Gautieria morchelliformis]